MVQRTRFRTNNISRRPSLEGKRPQNARQRHGGAADSSHVDRCDQEQSRPRHGAERQGSPEPRQRAAWAPLPGHPPRPGVLAPSAHACAYGSCDSEEGATLGVAAPSPRPRQRLRCWRGRLADAWELRAPALLPCRRSGWSRSSAWTLSNPACMKTRMRRRQFHDGGAPQCVSSAGGSPVHPARSQT